MNRRDFVISVANKTGLSATQVDQVLGGMIDVTAVALAAGESIEIRGFGTMSVRERKGGRRRHPTTGEEFVKEPHKAVHFRASEQITERVNAKKTKRKTA